MKMHKIERKLQYANAKRETLIKSQTDKIDGVSKYEHKL